MNSDDPHVTAKFIAVWLGTMFGTITLNQLVLGATLVFTLLQIFMLLRRLWKGLP